MTHPINNNLQNLHLQEAKKDATDKILPGSAASELYTQLFQENNPPVNQNPSSPTSKIRPGDGQSKIFTQLFQENNPPVNQNPSSPIDKIRPGDEQSKIFTQLFQGNNALAGKTDPDLKKS
ncbi:MAG TPA: hypothetical protein VLE96_03110 [Chlamydiales bacterium]|nr:hypothetical protein [Chlamydiales bacterium]